MGGLKLITAPTVEPVSLADAKSFLRIANTNLAANIDPIQSLKPDAYAVGTQTGSWVDVLGFTALCELHVGTLASGATLDVTIEESNDQSAVTTVKTFTQVTTANDEAVYEFEYTGSAQYLRFKAVVAVAAADFAGIVIKDSASSPDDGLLNALIPAARRMCEEWTRRAFIEQTWELALDKPPAARRVNLLTMEDAAEAWTGEARQRLEFVELPRAPLSSITSVTTYTDGDVASTWAATNYRADTYHEPGRMVTSETGSWPSDLRNMNSIIIRYKAGYGTAASTVPDPIRQAVKETVHDFYAARGEVTELSSKVMTLLAPFRVLRAA